jgi:hypothetical protein
MNETTIMAWGTGILQVSVAGYAFWLNRLFGTSRVGWSLFTAFVLLALSRLVESVVPSAPSGIGGMQLNFVGGLTSLLLFTGLIHIQIVLRERLHAKHQEERWESDLATLALVEERTAHLAQANEQLQTELAEQRQVGAQLADTNRALLLEMARIKTLSGLLPICAYCKNIRDDAGQWHGIERFIKDHTDARFTHGLCPDCARQVFPKPDGNDEESCSGEGLSELQGNWVEELKS